MKQNNPIFADLSTYTPERSIRFYKSIFGWEFTEEYGYYTAYLNNNMVVGLYETPDRFKQMRMPHFWMTYIDVNDVDKTVETAKNCGGIIELTDNIPGFGKIALIRDPKGAGFTIYQGSAIKNTRTQYIPNTLVWNELHTSDRESVIPFYKSIFNWKIVNIDSSVSKVYNQDNEHITDIIQISNRLKGKFEYWVSSFGIKSINATKDSIIENGGVLVIDEGERALFTDNSNQAFFYITAV